MLAVLPFLARSAGIPEWPLEPDGRVTVTAFAENTLAELESYEKTLEMDLALDTTLPETADLYPECWLSVEDRNARHRAVHWK